jgi:hypothetical protein
MRHLILALGILASSPVVLAQTASPPPPPPGCTAAENHQFDFWLGHWFVVGKAGKVAGDSRIEAILDGCGVRETWTGASGSNGTSLNLYNRSNGHWEQYWIDNAGNRLLLRGGLRDGAMVMESVEADGGPSTQRVTWTPNADGTVRQHWEASTDGGKTWATQFDGMYSRVEAG